MNISTSPWSLFLSDIGNVLNICAPLTARVAALACLTQAGADLGTLAGSAFLPVLLQVESLLGAFQTEVVPSDK